MEKSTKYQSIAFITELKKNVDSSTPTSQSFQNIIDTTIKPIVESPYLFNSYHYITDLLEQKLTFIYGVEKILGYKDEDFSLEKSIELIHPRYRELFIEYGLMTFQLFREAHYRPHNSRLHYCIQYPVKRIDGKYILVQMNTSTIQTDKYGNPIVSYHRIEKLGLFLDVPIIIRPRIYFRTINFSNSLGEEAERDISERVSKIMLYKLKITNRELLILKDFSNGLSGSQIAVLQNIGIETVKEHSKKILKKARLYLSPNFGNIKELAFYLKNIEII